MLRHHARAAPARAVAPAAATCRGLSPGPGMRRKTGPGMRRDWAMLSHMSLYWQVPTFSALVMDSYLRQYKGVLEYVSRYGIR